MNCNRDWDGAHYRAVSVIDPLARIWYHTEVI
jgi:hypothetical protein